MTDDLALFLDETSPERFQISGGGCGGWGIRWNIRKTGRNVPLPDLNDRDALAAADVPTLVADYAARLGLVRKDIAARGDTGVFAVDDGFEHGAGRHAVGICVGGGFFAFKTPHGVTMRRADPIEVWG